MDRQSPAGYDPPPVYTSQSFTVLAPPGPQGSSSRQSPRCAHPVDTDSRPLPPPPVAPPASPQVLLQTAQPTQNPMSPNLVIQPTAPASASPSAPSPPSRPSGFTSARPKWLRNSSKEAAAMIKEQVKAEAAAAEARQKAIAEAHRKAAEEQVLAEQKERERGRTREQTQERLRGLISQISLSEEDFKSVLRSCAQACAATDIDFAALLQEPILVGDLPVYWVIVKRPATVTCTRPVQVEEGDTDHGHGDPDALVLATLDFSRPLQGATIVAARRACMAVSDNALFRRFCRLFKEFAPVSDTDVMLLEGSGAQDDAIVEELNSKDGAFVARLKLTQFRLRMRVSKRVCVEFVARNRMWCLTFYGNALPTDTFPAEKSGQSKSGSSGIDEPWVVILRLGEHSSPTWVDAQLVITGNSFVPTESEHSSISIPLRTEGQKLQPNLNTLTRILDKSATGTDLTDGLSLFVDASGVLSACFEAKLIEPAAPEAGCVVC